MTMPDPATPTAPLGNPSQIAPTTPVAGGSKATPQAAAGAKPKKSASTLVITDGTSGQVKLKDAVTKWAKVYLPAGTEVRAVASWQAFYDLLAEYDAIDHLIIYLHGDPGGFGIGGHSKGIGVVVEEIQAAKTSVPRVTQTLTFESCKVGAGPVRTAEFARFLQAPTVEAWTFYHAIQWTEFTVTPTTTVNQVEKVLADKKEYLMAGTPSAADMVAAPKKYVVFSEWFQESSDQTPLPPAPAAGELDTRTREFRPRSELRIRQIKSDQAPALEEEYGNSITQPELVIITMPVLLEVAPGPQ
jgi:hypothetical protein